MGSLVGNQPSSRKRFKHTLVSDINVTPFVDVMLVLLIIFMVTAPMLTAGVNVDLPESKASPLETQDEPLTVTIRSDNTIFIQNTKVSLEEFAVKLDAIAKQKKDSRIFVRGDKRISYGRLMEIVGIINQAGYNKVAFLTENQPSKKN